MTGVLIKRGNLDTLTEGRRCEGTQGEDSQPCDWSDDIYKPRDAKDYWQTPEARRGKETFFPQTSEKAQPC